MNKKLMILISFLLILPVSYACRNPVLFNQYGSPIQIFGDGILEINGSHYPADENLILFNITARSRNPTDLTLVLAPTGLSNYVYTEESYHIPPLTTKEIGIWVYVDGGFKSGSVFVTGNCSDGWNFPQGEFDLRIYGRGGSAPQACKNTVTSCGIYPDCKNLRNSEEFPTCVDGFKRTYYCSNNRPAYSTSCSNFCCESTYGENSYCAGTSCYIPETCTDECSFSGSQCQDGDIYSCELQQDGCYDLIKQEECGSYFCSVDHCVNPSSGSGSIAFLCKDDSCDDGIEQDMMNWMRSQGWFVFGKKYDTWGDAELDDYDLMACSDELKACKTSSGTTIYNEHKSQRKPLLEISDYRNAQAAYRLRYISSPYEVLQTGDSLYATTNDIIVMPFITPFDKTIPILNSPKKMTVVQDYRLSSEVTDIADVGENRGRTTFFKVSPVNTQGRYAFVGWFYRASTSDLTSEGNEILNRTLTWLTCGDACLFGGDYNYPPVAVAGNDITVNLGNTAYFDGSASYDIDGDSLNYYWDFGDGSNSGWSTSPTAEHVYSDIGEYVVSLIVNDGKVNSEPDYLSVMVLPTIQNKVAFICKNDGCSETSEQEMMMFLENNGYSVDGKSEKSWTSSELNGYDFMVCTSTSGCNIHSWSPVFQKHKNERKGFLEVPDYHYVRGGKAFRYVGWWAGYSRTSDSIKIADEDDITQGYSGVMKVFNRDRDVVGIFQRNLKSGTKNLADLVERDGVSAEFKVDAADTHGRYAYVGWFNRASENDLTSDGRTLLLRTIRWVQCGEVDGC